MDHWSIEEGNIAELYLMGKLPPAQRIEFEKHFVDCPECLDCLKATDGFRQGLNHVVATDASRQVVLARRAAPGRPEVVVLPAVFFLVENGRRRDELSRKEPEFQGYRASISTAAGRRVWEGGDLTPNAGGTLDVGVYSGLLPAGDYELTLDGVRRQGRSVRVGRCAFRVIQEAPAMGQRPR